MTLKMGRMQQHSKVYKYRFKEEHKATTQKMLRQVTGKNMLPWTSFENIYVSSNEQLEAFMSKLDLKGKKVLTVGSSGDQVLYALAHGASEVVCIDVSSFTKYFYDYKVAGIKKFDYKTMQYYLLSDHGYFRTRYYNAVSSQLPLQTRHFWKKAFANGMERKIEAFWRPTTCAQTQLHKNERMYNKVRAALFRPHKVRHIVGDIRQLDTLLDKNDKFDVMLFSNVSDYIGKLTPIKKNEDAKFCAHYETDLNGCILDVIEKAKPHLNKNGSIQIAYRWTHLNEEEEMMRTVLDRKHEGKIWSVLIPPHSSWVDTDEGPVFYTPDRTCSEQSDT